MDPWFKVDYSRHIREASIGVGGLPEVIPPSGRVPGQRLMAAPILKWWRCRNREEIGKKAYVFRVSSSRRIYRRRGVAKGPPGDYVPPGRGHPLGRATKAPG